MSSYATLKVQGKELFRWRNEIDPTFLFLFTREDVVRIPKEPDEFEFDGDDEVVVLRSNVRTLRDRLDVLGVGSSAVQEVFAYCVKDMAALVRGRTYGDEDANRTEALFLEHLTLKEWVDHLKRALKGGRDGNAIAFAQPPSLSYLLHLLEDADPRFFVRAVLLAFGLDGEVDLDVTDLVQGGWMEDAFDPQAAAHELFSYAMANGSPAVVITEGSTDSNFLQDTIALRFPHLRSFIRFYDFDSGIEGSASAAVRTLKSFAAAGIANRVVLLLDNDTAAKDAVRGLKSTDLPKQYTVSHYPSLDLATSYPTLGPGGLSNMDVNGLAGSIELYLGRDALQAADGDLTPVQWRAYIEGMRSYQGEVLAKRRVQQRFREKLGQARADPVVMELQDWTGMDAIVRHLMDLLSA